MATEGQFAISTMLRVPAEELWHEVCSFDGVNYELACTITDRLGFALRRPLAALPGSRSPAARIVAATFRQRHRRLLARHGLG